MARRRAGQRARLGRIAKEADVRATPSGTHVAYLRVATNGLKDGTPSSTS
jgi:hypothetical protein